MNDETKLKFYLQAHRDGSLGTQELDPLDVLVMVDSGHFDYLAASDRTYWNDLTITHEGRRELCRLRVEAEAERDNRIIREGKILFNGIEAPDATELERAVEHAHPLSSGSLNEGYDYRAFLRDGGDNTPPILGVDGVNADGDNVRAMPFQEEPEPEPPVPEEHRPGGEFAVDLAGIVEEVNALDEMDGYRIHAWVGGVLPPSLHWRCDTSDGGESIREWVTDELVRRLEDIGLAMLVQWEPKT